MKQAKTCAGIGGHVKQNYWKNILLFCVLTDKAIAMNLLMIMSWE